MTFKTTPMISENRWDKRFESGFLYGIIGIIAIIGCIGVSLLSNGTFIGFFMTLFIPVIAWLYIDNGKSTTTKEIINRLKRFKTFNMRTIFTFILLVPTVVASVSYVNIIVERQQVRNMAEKQRQQILADNLERTNTPQINIQMITDLNLPIKGTGITLEYIVNNASGVYFNDILVVPSSGINYFSKFIELPNTIMTVSIKGQNKYWSGVQTFTISREQTEQEKQQELEAEKARIQGEKEAEQVAIQADIAEQKYLNSPEYKRKLLQDRVDILNTESGDEWAGLQVECKDTLKLMLKSPSTAEFPYGEKYNFRVQGNKIVADSYVDSQNSFGAQLRMYFECIYELDGETVNLVDIKELK